MTSKTPRPRRVDPGPDETSVAGEEDPGAALDEIAKGTPDAPQSAPAKARTAPAAREPATLPPRGPARVGAQGPSRPGGTAVHGVDLPLPHERDESLNNIEPKTDPRIDQARKDIESGQVDTDLHNTPGLDAENRARLLRRGRG